MEKRQYGSTGMNVSILGFGGADIGFHRATAQQVGRLLGSALDAGLNVIETAECYTASEELIGKTVAHRRSDYYLFTKCGHSSGFDLPDWDPRLLELSIDRSLRRLQTDYLDVIHLHNCSEEILRQGDVIDALIRAKEKGKTRFIGYSGHSKAALYAVRSGIFDSLETSINIADSQAIEVTVPEAAKLGMGVVAKRPIMNAAWREGKHPPGDHYLHTNWGRQMIDDDFQSDKACAELRFTLSVPGVHTAIVGMGNRSRWFWNARQPKGGVADRRLLQR